MNSGTFVLVLLAADLAGSQEMQRTKAQTFGVPLPGCDHGVLQGARGEGQDRYGDREGPGFVGALVLLLDPVGPVAAQIFWPHVGPCLKMSDLLLD